MLVPASLGLMAWSALSLPRLWRLVLDILHTRAWSKRIARTAPRTVDGVRFHLVDAPELGACTTGLLQPLIAVDRRLWRTLDRAQRRAVLHHENGHKARLDPLTLVALRACAAICLVPEGNPLLKCWQARAEAECDRHAASTIADPEPVASALLELERFRWPAPPGAHAAAGGGDLAARVRALLDPEWRGARANLRNDFVQAFAIVLVATVAVVLPSGEQLHHAAETLLGGLFGH
jgi:Zn-dependent protease with chaperone function